MDVSYLCFQVNTFVKLQPCIFVRCENVGSEFGEKDSTSAAFLVAPEFGLHIWVNQNPGIKLPSL